MTTNLWVEHFKQHTNYKESDCLAMVLINDIQGLTFLHEHGCPWSTTACAMAAYYGHFECLQYAVEHGCPINETTFSWALMNDNIQAVHYLHKHNCPRPNNIQTYCKVGSDCHSYLTLHGVLLDDGDVPITIR